MVWPSRIVVPMMAGDFRYSTPVFFFKLAKFHQKENLKIRTLIDFGGFELPEVREKTSKIHQISVLGFQFVAENIEG
jgi:hypothetical protein